MSLCMKGDVLKFPYHTVSLLMHCIIYSIYYDVLENRGKIVTHICSVLNSLVSYISYFTDHETSRPVVCQPQS